MKRSILLSTHERCGARLTERPEAPALPAVLTYGAVPSEYRAGREGALLLDETDRGLLRIGGADAAAFLHRILANDTRSLPPGGGQRNLLLSPKGKVLHDFELFVDGSGFRLDTAPGDDEALARAIDTYLFTEEVRIEDASESRAPLDLVGPAAGEVLARIGSEVGKLSDHGWTEMELGPARVRIARLAIAGSPGLRIDAEPGSVETLWSALREAGAVPGGIVARDMLRVEAGVGLFGVDIDENVYPQEARLEGAFSLEKGCYIGQEVVAKIDTYGGLNKRLVALRVDHDDPVPRGTRLLREVDGALRDLGLVTSWAYSFALDTGLALAYVKRRHQDPGTRFRFQGAPGTATLLPLPVRGDATAT